MFQTYSGSDILSSVLQATILYYKTGKMLALSSLPSSIEEAISFESDEQKEDLLCDWVPSDGTVQKCLKCEELSNDSCSKSISSGDAEDKAAAPLTHSSACYRFSNISNMCSTSAPNLVYKRRKLQSSSIALLSAQETKSTKSTKRGSDYPSDMITRDNISGQRNKTDRGGVSAVSTSICDSDLICNGSTSTFCLIHHHNIDAIACTNIEMPKGVDHVSVSESLDRYSAEEQVNEAADSKPAGEYYTGNDSFSSSKSNTEHGSTSMKIDMDDSGECSTSHLLRGGNMSEKEVCISILRSHGLLQRGSPIKVCASINESINEECKCSQLCKACGHSDDPKKMLICDNCEQAFHVSCFNPKIKKIPVYEWYCHPCSKQKQKLPAESTTKSSSKIKSEKFECRNRASKSRSSCIELMLKDSEPYTTNVRVGKGFQADIPEWSGPISEEFDCFGEPSIIDASECSSLHGWNTNRFSTPTVGNWLQCREVLDDSAGEKAGSVCGKWRRAPLFEVQTDDWDCSCSVLWDPMHSDCAVPQELETDQVLVHLKYIQLLRPRIAGNKRKTTISQNSEPEDGRTETSKQGADT